ncbi:MAG: Cof-type HAD-IIB family hydrolase [Selenomonadaceae bacterium]|nr:Cof-type HAD-IIB family hydrolase [Selenomonadaceae bacterium]MDY2685985.1 Cof-type HAD-IIB family hydrolase [Selenomonadaceae bacterium]
MAIKLIALDLDGTLLTSDKIVSPRTLAAIAAARARGVYVTIATGRMFKGAEVFGRQIEANAPLVCCNGGVVEPIGAEKPIFARKLRPDAVRGILTLCHERNWYVNWYIDNLVYVEHIDNDYFYAYRTVPDLQLQAAGDRFLDYTENVLQCVVRDLSGHVQDMARVIAARFPDDVTVQQNTGCSADITPHGVSKALGLDWLAKRLGIAPEEVMACGDGDNDLSMLRYAGTAVVPANGLPTAKELATYAADSNDEDGIAKAIEELVLR